jgi:hypothetical protein
MMAISSRSPRASRVRSRSRVLPEPGELTRLIVRMAFSPSRCLIWAARRSFSERTFFSMSTFFSMRHLQRRVRYYSCPAI